MPAFAQKACVTGTPQSGKTHRLIEAYLESLREEPFARRAFVVPNTSHRDHLRVKIVEQGGLNALPEDEIVTLAEFLYRLAGEAGLLTGRRMTRVEESLALLETLERTPAAAKLELPRALATARHFLKSIEAMRHAGLFLSLMDGTQPAPVSDDVSSLLLALAGEYYAEMRTRYDGLAGQERAVHALENAAPEILNALPRLVLIDGFYDLYPLYQRAVAALTEHAQSLYFSLPEVPGDETIARLAGLVDSLGLTAETVSGGSTAPGELLTTIDRVKTQSVPEEPAQMDAVAGAGIEIHPQPTYLREAEFIADRVLALHRREGIPLDDFLVVVNHAAPEFVSALEGEFAARNLPLIDLRRGQRPRLVTALLQAAFSYAAHPQADGLRTLMHAACPVFLPPTHKAFAYLHNMGAFLDAGKARKFLRDAGEKSFSDLLERLDALRKALSANRDFATLRDFAEELGNEALAEMDGDDSPVALDAESRAAEQAALDGIIEALDIPDCGSVKPAELLALAAEACSQYAGVISERRVGGVFLVDALMARQWQKAICFIPQCDVQRWPRAPDEATLGGDQLRGHLAVTGLKLRSPRETYEFEESLFLSAIVRATRKTFITFARREVSGHPQLPSPFLTPLVAALRELGSKEPKALPNTYADERALAQACAEALRYSEGEDDDAKPSRKTAAAVMQSMDGSVVSEYFRTGGIANEEPHAALSAAIELVPTSFSPNALTAYRKCPFLYFATKLLKLGGELETLEDGIGPMEVGIAVHEALKVAFEKYPERADVFKLFRDKLTSIAAAKGYLHDFELELAHELAGWNYSLREFYESEFRMLEETGTTVVSLEKDLSAKVQVYDAQGREFMLYGIPDRTDRSADGTVYIHDYKSGNPAYFEVKPAEGALTKLGVSLAPFIYPVLVQQYLKEQIELPPFSYALVRGNERRWVILKPDENDPRPPGQIVYEAIVASIALIQECEFPRAPHRKAMDCGDCEMYRICRRDIFRETLPNIANRDIPEGLINLAKERAR